MLFFNMHVIASKVQCRRDDHFILCSSNGPRRRALFATPRRSKDGRDLRGDGDPRDPGM